MDFYNLNYLYKDMSFDLSIIVGCFPVTKINNNNDLL